MRTAVLNTTAEVIPPGGAMEPVGTTDPDGCVHVRKPTLSNTLAVLVNGPVPIPADDRGVGSVVGIAALGNVPTLIGVDPATTGTGSSYGTAAGSWYFLAGNSGFKPIAERYFDLVHVIPDSVSSGGSLTQLVPLARIEVAPPVVGCDDLDDCVRQCWGPYYWCRVVTREAGDCGAWACGGCAFLQVVDGLPIPLGVPIPGWLIGTPPADIFGAALPVGFECAEAELATSPLYGVYAGDRSYMAVPGEDAGWCEAGGGRIHAKVCDLFVWVDCTGWVAIGPGYMGDVNGCATPPVIRQVVHFERMLSGDEFDEEGDPRACAPLFTYKRERNWGYRLERDGGDIVLYGPDPADPCGDTEAEISRIADCCEGGGGEGGGGVGCCPSTTWGVGGAVVASVPGVGFIFLDWVGADAVFVGSFTHPGCGLTIYLMFDKATCTCKWTCNPLLPYEDWLSLVQPVGFGVTCDAETGNVAGPYDDLDADGDYVAGGCEDNTCSVINNIFISTPLAP